MENEKYKIITIKKEHLKVIKTILKNNDNDALTCIQIRNGKLNVTNGKVVFTLETDYNIDGIWKIIGESKVNSIFIDVTLEKLDQQYPDLDGVIPNKTPESITFGLSSSITISSAVIKLYNFTGSAFDYKYLNFVAPLNLDWTVCRQDKDKPVLLENKKVSFLVMPFRI